MERDKEFDQEGLELTCLDLFKVPVILIHTLVVIFLINISKIIDVYVLQAGAETSSTTLMWSVFTPLSFDDMVFLYINQMT